MNGDRAGARIACADRPAADDVWRVGEIGRISNAVERRLRVDHDREPVGVIGPREGAAVDDDAAERGAVAADELRQRVDHHVGPVTERFEQERRRDRIVRDDRNAARVGSIGHGGQINHVARWVADGLAEHGLRSVVDQGRDRVRVVVG